jgi:hypothetical protein
MKKLIGSAVLLLSLMWGGGCSTTSMAQTDNCIEQDETNSAEVANTRLQHCLDKSYQVRRAERSTAGALFGDLMVAILQRAFSN